MMKLMSFLKAKGCELKAITGFTLIELLVVIAIISLLSSIVLASLGQARAKAADAAIKQNLISLRSEAELLYDQALNCYTDGSSGVSCPTFSGGHEDCLSSYQPSQFPNPTFIWSPKIFANEKIRGILATIENFQALGHVSCVYSTGHTSWAVVAPLKNTAVFGWCIDSSGNSRLVSYDYLNYTTAFESNFNNLARCKS